ncbi:MAG: hypothetical protein AB7E79_06710 [Rhodospirillaceae bacterium]
MLRNLFSNVVARGCSRVVGCLVLAAVVFAGTASRGAEVNVGPGRALQTLKAGVAAAKAGDRVVLDAGVYLDDVATIDKPLTIEGAGRGAVLRITKPISNRKGILVVNADVTVRKLTFEGAHVTDADGKNGAGIRHQAGRLTIDTCVFSNNQNGILANPNGDATISVRRTAFNGNGSGDGYTHAMYINAIASLTVSDSTFAGTKVGHNIKSRALKTTVTDTLLDDGVSGTPSYAIDLPNGGEVVLKRVRITQGQRTNNSTMVAYGAEKALHENSSLTITGSTFINRAQNSTAINNFSSITATLSDNKFENVGETTKGLIRLIKLERPASIREGAVFSSLDPNARSYLRFHNMGTGEGSVSVGLYDSRDGRLLGKWTSPPIPPNASPQFGIDVIEAALHVADRPPSYSIVVESAMTGSFQHVLHRAASGVLSNLSTCSAGVARSGSQLSNVHTSALDDGYPATILVQNRGPVPAAAQIGIYDARQGRRVGAYTTPEVAVDGEVMIRMSTIEAGARVAPAWDMAHWVLKIENDFSGSLQQLIGNTRAGVITDMTAVCDLGAPAAEPETQLSVGAVFPTGTEIDSHVLVHNTGTRAGPLRLALYDAASGSRMGQWESPAIAPNTSRQYAVSDILSLAAGDNAASRFYRVEVEGAFTGFVQHLIRHAGGTISNLSSCDAATTASLIDVASLRASSNEPSDLALIVLNNSGRAASSAELDVFVAGDGRPLGSFETAAIPPGASIALTVVDVEAALALGPGIGSYNVRLKDGFTGSLQYLLVNLTSGAVTDMTTACALGAVSYQ